MSPLSTTSLALQSSLRRLLHGPGCSRPTFSPNLVLSSIYTTNPFNGRTSSLKLTMTSGNGTQVSTYRPQRGSATSFSCPVAGLPRCSNPELGHCGPAISPPDPRDSLPISKAIVHSKRSFVARVLWFAMQTYSKVASGYDRSGLNLPSNYVTQPVLPGVVKM